MFHWIFHPIHSARAFKIQKIHNIRWGSKNVWISVSNFITRYFSRFVQFRIPPYTVCLLENFIPYHIVFKNIFIHFNCRTRNIWNEIEITHLVAMRIQWIPTKNHCHFIRTNRIWNSRWKKPFLQPRSAAQCSYHSPNANISIKFQILHLKVLPGIVLRCLKHFSVCFVQSATNAFDETNTGSSIFRCT